jgi:hypothetical protein
MEDFTKLLPHLSLLPQRMRVAEPVTPNQHMRSILTAYQVCTRMHTRWLRAQTPIPFTTEPLAVTALG